MIARIAAPELLAPPAIEKANAQYRDMPSATTIPSENALSGMVQL